MGVSVQLLERAREATAALEKDRGLLILGGGTLVVRQLNEGDVGITGLVRCVEAAGTEIRVSGGRVQLQAGVTMSQVIAHRELGWLAPAARLVGGPAVRNMATVGGNLFAPAPFGDFGVALLALDATVAVHQGYSGRELPLAEFFATRETQWRRCVVTSVSFRQPLGGDFRIFKATRVKPKGAAVLTIAAVLTESGGRFSQPRVAYGAMAPTPMRAKGVEQALNGKPRTVQGIAAALEAAAQDTLPADDPICSAWYRSQVAPVHLSRLLLGPST